MFETFTYESVWNYAAVHGFVLVSKDAVFIKEVLYSRAAEGDLDPSSIAGRIRLRHSYATMCRRGVHL
jgi:hypothetical protein